MEGTFFLPEVGGEINRIHLEDSSCFKKAMLAHEDKPLKPKFLAGTRVLTLKS